MNISNYFSIQYLKINKSLEFVDKFGMHWGCLQNSSMPSKLKKKKTPLLKFPFPFSLYVSIVCSNPDKIKET